MRLISINVFRPIEEHFNIVYIHYINSQDNVVLGGTRQRGEEKFDKDQKYYDDIIARCCRLVPSLKNAEIVRTWVGLRPWRSSVRLETDVISVNGKRVPVSPVDWLIDCLIDC